MVAGSGEFERTMTDEIELAPSINLQEQRRVFLGSPGTDRGQLKSEDIAYGWLSETVSGAHAVPNWK